MKLNLRFLIDPGHGWISVPRKYLYYLGIENDISPYSYQKGNRVYLEEDKDAMIFINAAKSAGWEISLKDSFNKTWSWVRNLERYTN
ncbi:MAG: hypothetical protein ACOCP4_01985 [Candidatus Woesearchaeota archaeon]